MGLEWSPAKVSRIENALVGVLPRDVKLLAGLYGADSGDDRERLIALARLSRQRPWWQRHGLDVPVWFRPYAALEAEAEMLSGYSPERVPDLLQIPAYRGACPAPPGLGDPDAAQLAALLTARQHRRAVTGWPGLHVVVSESVLRRPVGGPAVMAAQLARLAEASGESGVTIQVLPFTAGAHPAMDSPFALLAFPDPADPAIASPAPHAACLDDTDAVQRYRDAFAGLCGLALPPQDSRDLITRAAGELPGHTAAAPLLGAAHAAR
jgi:hypothetical protein